MLGEIAALLPSGYVSDPNHNSCDPFSFGGPVHFICTQVWQYGTFKIRTIRRRLLQKFTVSNERNVTKTNFASVPISVA